MLNDADALPAEIEALVKSVVARARLRRGERADIVRELRAHFRDGLASGRPAAELVHDFGDPIASAKALRAGAIAKRSGFDRGFHATLRAACWGFGVLIAVYAIAVLGLRASPPVISFDATERYHAMFPVAPDGDQGWPLYKRGLVALADPAPKREGYFAMPQGTTAVVGHDLGYTNLGPSGGIAIPGDAGWDQARKALIDGRGGIDQLVAASRKAALGFRPGHSHRVEDADVWPVYSFDSAPAARDQTMFSILLPHLSLLRMAARFVATDSMIALGDGDGQRFVDDITALLRIADHSEEGHLLISQLVGTAIRHLASDRVTMAMEWRPDALTDADLLRLAGLLDSIPAERFEVDLASEEIGLKDIIQRIYSDDGNGDGYFNAAHGGWLLFELTHSASPDSDMPSSDRVVETLTAPLQAIAFATRRELTQMIESACRRTEAESRRPIWEQDFGYESDLERQFRESTLAEVKWPIPRLLLPPLRQFANMRQLSKAQRDAARTAVAMIQFQRAHGGAWPASLAELSPTLLPTAPLDPYTGKPLGYRLDGTTPIAWSVGADRRDEEGKPVSSSNGEPLGANKPTDPDWAWFVGGDGLARWKKSP